MDRPAVMSVLAALVLWGGAIAQGRDADHRDKVFLADGSVVEGRVAEPFATDEILVMQGGKRVRVPRAKVKELQLVRQMVAEFLDRRRKAAKDVDANWALVGWATEHQLDDLARLQALTVVMLDDEHEAAQTFLGHRHHPKRGWLWPDGHKWYTRKSYEEHHASWGHALELPAEHFVLRTDGGLARGIEVLIDLERLYVLMFDEFGQSLVLAEALRPMQIKVWKDEKEFPKWESGALPYFVPAPFDDAGNSYYPADGDRPVGLFEIGTQMVLYRCLARDGNPGGPQQRYCATAELGFARWMQSRMNGAPGRAVAGEPTLGTDEANLALHARDFGVENLLHLSLRSSFYGGFGDTPAISWASAHAFVAFLMDQELRPSRRDAFLHWLRLALAEGKGDSSSAFDDAFGTPIESLEEPFKRWLSHRDGR